MTTTTKKKKIDALIFFFPAKTIIEERTQNRVLIFSTNHFIKLPSEDGLKVIAVFSFFPKRPVMQPFSKSWNKKQPKFNFAGLRT